MEYTCLIYPKHVIAYFFTLEIKLRKHNVMKKKGYHAFYYSFLLKYTFTILFCLSLIFFYLNILNPYDL